MPELKNTRELGIPMDATFRWSVGACMETFIGGLGKRKLLGIRCPRCDRVFVPPRMICERCFAETEEWVEVGPMASTVACTTAFVRVDAKAGGLLELDRPEILALIKPDGADSAFVHRVFEILPEDMREDIRLEAMWTAQPSGDLTDLLGFRPK